MDYLSHYGTKGMKWGIRKAYQPIGRRYYSRASKSVQTGRKMLQTGNKVKSKVKESIQYKIERHKKVASFIFNINKKGGMKNVNANAVKNRNLAYQVMLKSDKVSALPNPSPPIILSKRR